MQPKIDKPKNVLGAGLTSQVAATLFVVAILNLALWYFQPFGSVDPAKLPSLHTWEWWRTQDYLRQKESPDVVLLGSSLIMNPVSILDADYLNKDIDAVHHPRCAYAEDRLANALHVKDPVCFNFGLPGGMVSDDFMVARALFPRKKPKLLVVGLTLRDFIESHVQCASSTPTYHYFSHFFPVDDLVDQSMPEFWQRFDYWQGKLVYLLGKRLDAQLISAEKTKAFVAALFGAGSKQNPLDEIKIDHSANVARKLRSVAEEGEFILEANKPTPYEDNSGEYRTRFRRKNDKLFAAESFFLDRLLQFTQKEGIETVIVNMPLTTINMRIMPPGSYDKYMATVQNAAARYNCAFVDMNDFKTFAGVDFQDTAHMNANGGRKFVDQLVAAIEKNDKLAATLDAGGQTNRLSAKSQQAL